MTVQNPGGVDFERRELRDRAATAGAGRHRADGRFAAATGKDITVVDLSTNGSSIPAQDVSLSLMEIGNFQTSTNTARLAPERWR